MLARALRACALNWEKIFPFHDINKFTIIIELSVLIYERNQSVFMALSYFYPVENIQFVFVNPFIIRQGHPDY